MLMRKFRARLVHSQLLGHESGSAIYIHSNTSSIPDGMNWCSNVGCESNTTFSFRMSIMVRYLIDHSV
eukprot:3715087-Amphidinium_carterae.1